MVDYKNRYPGINPHLNSRLQSPGGGWETFHASCIEHLAMVLETQLPENYLPFTEKSLQVTLVESDTEVLIANLGTRYPDVFVTHEGDKIAGNQQFSATTPTLTLPLVDSFDEEEILMGLVIYRFTSRELPGVPVTRIELLSPANKPGGSNYAQYIRNRRETLLAGLRLVEIDWLHETRPIIPTIPSYPDHEAESYPYSIIVSDPRPSIEQGKTDVYSFRLSQPLPIINIPLDGSDVVTLDFTHVYNETIERRRFFSLIDYAQLPARFETYSDTDQAYIRQHMGYLG
jgi:Protein of unknown function (DUF4058)